METEKTTIPADGRAPRDDRIDVAGARLASVTWPGPGPALVLLPGAGGNALLFADLVDSLPERHTVAIDPPGMGRSDDPPTLDLAETADALAHAWRRDGHGPAVWGGHSWGGKVAALVASRNPDVAVATVLIDPSPATSLELDDDTLTAFAASIWDGKGGPWDSEDAAMAGFARLPHYAKWTTGLRSALARNLVQTADRRWTTRCDHRFLEAVSRATLNVDNGRDVGRLAVPTLYLVASRSTWWQEISNDRALPDHAERVVVDGEHFLHLDNLTDVSRAIADFVARTAGTDGATRR